MRNWKFTAVGVLALAGTLSACDDFLEGPGLTTSPNVPSSATINQLFTASQVHQFGWFEGDISRVPSMWVQQMAGTDRQYIAYANYEVSEDELDDYFTEIYIGGGLVDLRSIQARAAEQGDQVYQGIAQIWEAFLIGTAASLWGDIPYSQAVGENPKPELDAQEDVYAAVQSLLGEAIANLQSGNGAGPGSLDLVYGGDTQKWIEAANTLKARFYMHWVEAQNAGVAAAQTACGGDCVQQAIAAAQQGISSPANNLVFPHTNKPGEQNIWYQFTAEQRPGYISAGEYLVELLKERNDPRLEEYFAPVDGEFLGAPAGEAATASSLSDTRGAPNFAQPMVTYAENQLILAEAQYRQGNAGAALTHLNNARDVAGLPASSASGEALFREIMLEKYIALFQNPEAWNDYKRTCIPALTPAGDAEVIPGRFLYGSSERNVNPNIPAPADQPARNTNDPNACA